MISCIQLQKYIFLDFSPFLSSHGTLNFILFDNYGINITMLASFWLDLSSLPFFASSSMLLPFKCCILLSLRGHVF